VAKILVADDNSNVQKTVALALAELAVEVVAVNNGDAAVRKLAEISPDLILADIFMPVRNGYEVCEFVKKDSRFSHVPVVLLVGAFDPLDEPEAQRVGADGILKKPFVPPDPLIAMVKTLLDRTLGDRMVAVAISKPAVSMQGKAGGGVATAEVHPTTAEAAEELPEQEIPPSLSRLSFGEGEHPIAFGQLLDPPAKDSSTAGTEVVEPVDDEQILTSSRDSSLGDPIFWRTEEPEPKNEEEDSESEGDISSAISSHEWNLGEDALSTRAGADQPPAIEAIEPVEPFELVRDEDNASQTSTIVESSSLIAQDAASQASLTVEAARPPDLAANPIEWMASVPPPPAEKAPEADPEWSAAATETADNLEAIGAAKLESVPEPIVPESHAPFVAPVPVSASAPARPSVPPPPAPPAPPQATVAAQTPYLLKVKAQPSLRPSGQSTEDTARSIPKGDWADLAASLQPKSIEPPADKPKPASPPVAKAPAVPAVPASIAQPAPVPAAQKPAAPEGSAKPAPANSAPLDPPDPALVEAVVQRVLEKMHPQVVDIITKEFLRPVVQALVHREIQKR
jgi:CheY-like chemotaxis protein